MFAPSPSAAIPSAATRDPSRHTPWSAAAQLVSSRQRAPGEAVVTQTSSPPSPLVIGLVFGGRSGEHDVSICSARTIATALTSGCNSQRYRLSCYYISRTGHWFSGTTAEAALAGGAAPLAGGCSVFQLPAEAAAVDVWFPVLHGPNGEDGTIQGLFTMAGRPFVGSGVLGAAVGMDKSVMVLGAGPIGQLVIAVLAHIGTDLIIASDLSASRLEMAAAMGAHRVIDAAAGLEERQQAVQELTGGIGPDIVIETAGVPVVFKESLDLVKRGGIVVEVGHFTDPGGVDIHPNTVCFKDLDIRGMWAYPAMQFKTALSFLKNSAAPLDRFITHRVALADTEEGIRLTGSEGSMKVVVEP